MLKAITIGRATFEINLVVDKLPDEGTVNEYFDKGGNIGGGTGIVGTALSKWGVAVAMATVLGNDNNGTRVRKILESLRIDTRYIEPSYDNDTPLSLIVSNNNSGRHTAYNLSDKFVSLKKLDFDFQPDFIYSDGYDATQTKNLFERYGAINAASLDGGTSTMMIEKGEYVNSPWNGYRPTYRWLPNAWIVVE